MARPRKQGLDYFPLDVDIDQDDKIQLVEAVHGPVGFAIVIKLLMRIYKDGYFSKWTETEQLLFSKRVNVDINLINECINDCVKWDLFDKNIFETYGVLTSNGIQTRFLEAVGRRQKVEMVQEYLLLDLDDIKVYKNLSTRSINVDINSLDVNINPQSKVKNSKEKNSKEEHTKEEKVRDDNPKKKDVPSPFHSKINVAWNENIFPLLSPTQSETLAYWEQELSEDLVLKAIQLASNQGKRTFGYVEGILKRFVAAGFKSVADVDRAEHERKQNAFQQPNRFGKPTRVEVVPEWFDKNKQMNQEVSVESAEIAAERERLKQELAGGI